MAEYSVQLPPIGERIQKSIVNTYKDKDKYRLFNKQQLRKQ